MVNVKAYRAFLIGLAACLIASGTLCINASKVNGKIQYASIVVTFLVELTKFIFCLVVIFTHGYSQFLEVNYSTLSNPSSRFRSLYDYFHNLRSKISFRASLLLYSVPALLYMIDNNITYIALYYVDPPTLSILWNTKILITAGLCRFIFNRKLDPIRWSSMILLTIGIITTQANRTEIHHSISNLHTVESNSTHGSVKPLSNNPSNTLIGLLWVAIGVTTSSIAGVYNEWSLKKYTQVSVFLQNAQLYFYGILFNGAILVIDIFGNAPIFHAYNNWVLGVIFTQSMAGLTIGIILKFLDNIDVILAHTIAMLFSMFISAVFFNFHITLTFLCGFGVCTVSLYLYNIDLRAIKEDHFRKNNLNPTEVVIEYECVDNTLDSGEINESDSQNTTTDEHSDTLLQEQHIRD